MGPTDARDLDVLLGDIPVGRLALEPGGLARFVFFESYRARYPRPVLGQAFEDDLGGRYVGKGRLPVWFSNLLPEGALRVQVQAEIGRAKRHELAVLGALAEDLPGAVRMTDASADDAGEGESTYAPRERAGAEQEGRLRFSLAGVQLKFSVLRSTGGGVTVPARGVGGEWIVKLPDAQFPCVPLNEHTMMSWARLAGMEVPDVALVDAAGLEGISRDLFTRDEPAYVVRRFDRGLGGQRIHMEDMAQVFSLYPEDKYTRFGFGAIARVVRAAAGEASYAELIRRYVFMIATGNSDMHHKNWSLLYPDGVHAALAPAYDLVATVVYPSVSDELGLKFGKTRRWEEVRESTFHLLAEEAKADVAETLRVADETLDALVRTRTEARDKGHLGAEEWARIDAHWKRVPLLARRLD